MSVDGVFNLESSPLDAVHNGKGAGGGGEEDREVRSVKEVLQEREALAAGLTAEEVVALRLWTGPMAIKYNAVLTGMYVYVYVCMYLNMCIYTYICVYTYVYIHMYIHIYVCICIHIFRLHSIQYCAHG